MAYYIALVVILPALIPLSQNLGISVLRALNKHRFRSIIYFFIALFNVALSIPLAIRFNGFGAACATGLATCMGQILTMNWFYHRKIGLDIPGYWKTDLSADTEDDRCSGVLSRCYLLDPGIRLAGIDPPRHRICSDLSGSGLALYLEFL